MRLRKQLFLISLFTLSLPWAGCQYLKEIEETLIRGQTKALEATASAVAATILNDPVLLQKTMHYQSSTPENTIYLHPIKPSLILDGYAEEWGAHKAQQLFQGEHTKLPAYASGARSKGKTWLFIDIPSENIHYYNPSQHFLDAERLVLTLINDRGNKIERTLVASSPGQVRVFNTKDRRQDHNIKAIWKESERGYHVELSMPATYSDNGLTLNVYRAGNPNAQFSSRKNLDLDSEAIGERNAQTAPVYPSVELSKTLDVFARPGLRLKLITPYKAVIGESGTPSAHLEHTRGDAYSSEYQPLHTANPSGAARIPEHSQDTPWPLKLLYRFALGAPDHETLPSSRSTGYVGNTEVVKSIAGETAHERYIKNQQTLIAMSVPLIADNTVIAVVHAEQLTDSVTTLVDQALGRLIAYSVLISFTAALVLIAYASWLSLRISRLNQSTSKAISDSGTINTSFHSSRLNDEVGELSRSFAELLNRTHEYTDYLKTLSNKLSHELRTPLAIVSSSLDNLEYETVNSDAHIYAQRAKDGVSRLSSILNAMSAANRVEQAIQNAEKEALAIGPLLEEAVSSYQSIYPDRQFQLQLEASPSASSVLIQASPELFMQMLDKLVTNAVEFCPVNGRILLGVTITEDSFSLSVQNDGPLLPSDMQSKLFDSMVSIRPTTAKATPEQTAGVSDQTHLGLGLYIVKLIVDFHNGMVSAKNRADLSGVVFELHFPRFNPK